MRREETFLSRTEGSRTLSSLSLESTASLRLAEASHLHSCRSSFFQQVTETEASGLNAHGDKGPRPRGGQVIVNEDGKGPDLSTV